MIYDKRTVYDPRVGGHEAVDISPYFKDSGIKGGGKYGSRIIGTTPAEVGDVAFGIARYEARHQGHLEVETVKYIVDQHLSGVIVKHVLVPLLFSLYEVAAVKVNSSFNDPRYND